MTSDPFRADDGFAGKLALLRTRMMAADRSESRGPYGTLSTFSERGDRGNRVCCEGCAFERLVPFSCKGRGFCPSCGGRRMTERAAHLVEAVLPRVPVRQ